MTTHHDDTLPGVLKVFVAWIGMVLGAVTMQDLVLFATLIYTLIQTLVLIRDKIINWKRPPHD